MTNTMTFDLGSAILAAHMPLAVLVESGAVTREQILEAVDSATVRLETEQSDQGALEILGHLHEIMYADEVRERDKEPG
jgi:hypothetical protein